MCAAKSGPHSRERRKFQGTSTGLVHDSIYIRSFGFVLFTFGNNASDAHAWQQREPATTLSFERPHDPSRFAWRDASSSNRHPQESGSTRAPPD
jgi:hypothetical protein